MASPWQLNKSKQIVGTGGSAPGQFNQPHAVCINPNNPCEVLVSDTKRVQGFCFDPALSRFDWKWSFEDQSLCPEGLCFQPATNHLLLGDYHGLLRAFSCEDNKLLPLFSVAPEK
jgi:hypothetical protein